MTGPDRDGLSLTPGGDDPAGWLAFVAETRALVGDREPLALLAVAPGWLATAIDGLDDTRLQTPERAAAWSIAQVLAHLADTEMTWGFRIRQVLTTPHHVMDGFDQSAWAERFDYAAMDPRASLALFGALRVRNLVVWRSLGPDDWAREAWHSQRPGGESLRAIAQLLAGHDLRHERQVGRIRAVLGAPPVPPR